MKRTAELLFLIILLSLFSSCKFKITDGFYRKNNIRERTKPILTIESPDTNDNAVYSAVIINDPHFGRDKTRRDEAFYQWFKEQCEQEDETLRPRFMVNMGDTTEYGFKESYEEYLSFCSRIKAIAKEVYKNDSFEIYNLIGNHDLYNGGWKTYSEMMYPYTSYYRFTTKASSSQTGISWYFLDSANGTHGKRQIEDLKGNIRKDENPKIVLTHYPVYGDDVFYFSLQNTDERDILLSLFSKTKVILLLHGHYHPGTFYDYGKFQEIGNKGYLDYNNCALVTVNENTGTYSYKRFTY